MSDRTIPFPRGASSAGSTAGGFRTFFRTGPGSAVRAVALPETSGQLHVRGESLARAIVIARAVEHPAQANGLTAPHTVTRLYGAGLYLVTANTVITTSRFRLPGQLRTLAGRLHRRVRG